MNNKRNQCEDSEELVMKEKIKNFVFSMLLFYSIFVVLIIVINMFNLRGKIEIHDKEDNLNRLSDLKARANNLEKNSCGLLVDQMISKYEETSYDGEVILSEFYDLYWEGASFLQFYSSFKTECGMSDEKIKELDLDYDVLNSITFFENVVNKHMFYYEISLSDKYMREISEANIENIEYQTCKKSELDIIEKMINYVGGEYNE